MQGRKRARLLYLSSFLRYPWTFFSGTAGAGAATAQAPESDEGHKSRAGLQSEGNIGRGGEKDSASGSCVRRLSELQASIMATCDNVYSKDRPSMVEQQMESSRDSSHVKTSFLLPAEIIHEILVFTDRSTLTTSATVNRTFQHISQRLLYRHLEPQPSKIIPCLKTLAARPTLAAMTRRFMITDITKSHNPLAGYLSLLSRALHNMTALTELTLLLDGPFANMFIDCPFRLRSLSTTLHWNHSFTEWMAEQTEIDDAMFGGTFVMGCTIASGTLRKLTRVSASPLILATVVPGRAVKDVEVCVMQPGLFKQDIMWTTTKIMSFAACPLRSLQIIASIGSPADALAALGAIPENLSTLKSLSVHAACGSVTTELLEGLQDVTSRFEHLRSVLLISRDTSDALHDTSAVSGLAAKWHSSCKSLECVSFPIATWVHNQKYGWMTVGELERILVEREKTLRNREKELEERERILASEQRALELREIGIEKEIKSLRTGLVRFGAETTTS
ncbi:hypothetical protein BV22DRAFT_1068235 [Leucogyrophana mollusca]|uniref:Uncharacterized protein n=1 Tax=Leucogyrophana mollusca TaxID=85980 RepID=A0ACB8BDG2_9AGAM|nr:hypothetical protein BV22DRAFT_1068235 [Leucogyrophana mollusca]